MYKIGKCITISARKSQVYYANRLEELGISTGQYMYLVSLCENEGISQEQLGEIVGINKSTTAKVIGQLEAQGHVRREQDLEDKRGYKLYPTQKAKDVYPLVIKILDQWNEYLADGLTKEEQSTLFALLSRVEANARKH